MDVNCPVLLITNIKPLRGRTQAESLPAWNCHLEGKKGFRAPNLRAYSTCAHSRTTALVSSDTAFVRTGGTHARTHV
ncbi:hypothetical protein V8C42DRAFT_324688 [Trichoderma barbatum]